MAIYYGGGGPELRAIHHDGRAWTLGEAYVGAPDASFGTFSRRHGLHYLVEERAAGSVGAYRHGPGGWEMLARMPSGGDGPCHVALDPDETLLAVANYVSGTVALARLDPASGLPVGAIQVHLHHGSGPSADRQEGPHAHWVGFSPDGRWLYRTDLGTDEVLAFAIAADGTLGDPVVAYAAPPGSGPRHLLLHPTKRERAYLVSELASTLTVLDRAEGRFTARRIVSTLPEGAEGHSIAAHIGTNAAATRLYVSNRGHDSIAVFALDGAGEPTLLQHAPAGGAYPRFCLLAEQEGAMLVANEQGETVTVLPLAADGRLGPPVATLAIPGVSYVLRIGDDG